MKTYKFDRLPSPIDLAGTFGEECELSVSEKTLGALKTGKLNIRIHKHGAQESIAGLRISIDSIGGDIQIYAGRDNATVVFEEGTAGSYQLRLWANSKVSIGKNTTSSGIKIVCDNSEFRCGEDCLFSDGILVQSADQHAIVDIASGKIINNDYKSVVLGDHVWLGRYCTLTGNAHVGSGSVIGTGAIVTGLIPEKTVAAGVPARVIKENHTWSRSPDSLDEFSRRCVEDNSL